MKDNLINDLAERFASHEAAVDPGTWEAISGQLTVAQGDALREMLQDKFTGHEAPVDAQVWTNISSQLGHGAAAGFGGATAWLAAGVAATIIAGGFLFFNASGPETTTAALPVTSITQDAGTSTSPNTAGQPSQEAGTIALPIEATALTNTRPEQTVPAAPGHSGANVPVKEPASADHDIDPAPAPTSAAVQGEEVVNNILQDIVDNYVTSPQVVVTEPVPLPTQQEMPSEEVHLRVDDEAGGEEPDNAEELPAPVLVPAASPEFLIPTAFSPNGDGVNDALIVSGLHYQKATVRIFSATNNVLVFSANDLRTQWNGTMMNGGQPCEPGMYFYALEVTGTDGLTWSKGEVIRLFR